ncbi:hypothetical protein, partial [Streptomyces angustmyceticus]|uniref:hypothetical protein n=1 Tax=Streptomyces angustmyceticus TaxID=285578 RepID=UPI001ABEFB16
VRHANPRTRLPFYVWNVDTVRPLRYTEAVEIPDFARHENYRGRTAGRMPWPRRLPRPSSRSPSGSVRLTDLV